VRSAYHAYIRELSRNKAENVGFVAMAVEYIEAIPPDPIGKSKYRKWVETSPRIEIHGVDIPRSGRAHDIGRFSNVIHDIDQCIVDLPGIRGPYHREDPSLGSVQSGASDDVSNLQAPGQRNRTSS
jgi:hypothetical protein